jgi:hypothetical protein
MKLPKLNFRLPEFRLPQRVHATDAKPVSATWLIRLADKAVLLSCIGAIIAVYILDAIFFAGWAGDFGTGYLWIVFILIALVIRTLVVSAGVVLQWVRGQSEIATARGTIRALWVVGIVLCLVPATSFFAGGHKVNTQAADVAAATETVSTTSKTERIGTLTGQIGAIETRLAGDVEEVNKSITAIMDDGVPGISKSDNESLMTLRAEIKDLRTKADADIEAKRAEIRSIEQESETVKTNAAETETRVSPFMAIFVVFEETFGVDSDITSKTVLLLFALLIEAIAAFGLGAYYDMHRVFVRLINEAQAGAVLDDVPQPDNDEAEDNRLTPSERGRKGAQAANMNRKMRNMDNRINVGERAAA